MPVPAYFKEENVNTDNYQRITTELNYDPNLHFILRQDDMERTLRQPTIQTVEMALKKAALYGKRVVIVGNSQTEYVKDSYNGKDHGKHFWLGGEVSLRLNEIYEKLNRVPTFNETFYFLPERVEEVIETWQSPDDWESTDPRTKFEFDTAYKNKLGIDMSISHPTINTHIFETLHCKSDELSIRNVWLPELKNVPLDVLLKIRANEDDAFTKFQFAIKNLITDTKEIESEAKLLEVFQKVDYEVRAIETKMKQIKKLRSVAAHQAFLGVCAMGLCLALPSEASQIFSSMLGIYGAKEYVSHLLQEPAQIHELKSSDFYVPWMCTRTQSKDK